MARGTSPQIRGLDGSHRDNYRTRPHHKFQVDPRSPRKGVVQQHQEKEDNLEKPNNRIKQVLLHPRKVNQESSLQMEQVQVRPSHRRHRRIHTQCPRVRHSTELQR